MKLFNILFILLFTTVARAGDGSDLDFSFERDASVPIVNLSMVFRAGAISDPKGALGLTAFTGEMLLKGTRLRTKRQLQVRMDELGSNIEMDVRSQLLMVRASVLSSKIKPFLELLSEIILKPSFSEPEIKKLKSQTVSGLISARSHDGQLARAQFAKFLFDDHPLGRPVEGLPSHVKRFTRAMVLKQYQTCFQRDGIILVGTGDVSPEVIETWGRALVSNLPKTQKLRLPEIPKPPIQRRLLIVDKPDLTQSPLIVGQIGIPFSDQAYFPLFVGNHGFGGPSFSSRLMTEIRVKRGWSYGAGSRLRPSVNTGEWSYGFSPATKDLAPALKFSLDLAQELQRSGISSQEFEFAKDSLINSAGFMYNTPGKRIENTLLEKALRLPDGFFRSYAQEIQKLTLNDVNAQLANFIKPESFTIVVVGSAAQLKKPLAEAAGIPESEVIVKKYTEE